MDNFDVPEINVTPFSITDTAMGSNELPVLPFSSREDNALDIFAFE